MRYLATLISMVLVMVGLDVLWIGFIAKSLYQSGIGHLMAEKPDLLAALSFYLIFCSGLLWFAVLASPAKRGMGKAITNAAIFGFCAYATYDLTNLATLKAWPVSIALIDMLWGTLASVIAVTIGKKVFDKFDA
jgi:uncharacterized membrane protein